MKKLTFKVLLFIFLLGALLYTPCINRLVLGHACPACGTRRALGLLLQGKIKASILMNPLGLLVSIVLLFIMGAAIYQKISGRPYLQQLKKKTDSFLGHWYVISFVFILVLLNWWWNILKFG